MSTDHIELWHQRARPEPTHSALMVQTGCHFEEVMEMLACIRGKDEYSDLMLDRLHTALTTVSLGMKQGTVQFEIRDREDFLDSICDQQVTAIGVAHCAGMKATEGLRRVNASNWSKFDVDGKPIFDENGKIKKGPNYHPPKLDGCY
jgi:predicted HAD superfamily Cof-like phosphohydrolase